MDIDRAPGARPAGIAPRSPRASADDELPPHLARLRNEIACGLYAQLPIRNETIEQEDVAGVAYALVVRLIQSFRFEWVRPADDADDEEWSLDAATFHGSHLGPGRYPIFDWD
jgi:hypothetical protein